MDNDNDQPHDDPTPPEGEGTLDDNIESITLITDDDFEETFEEQDGVDTEDSTTESTEDVEETPTEDVQAEPEIVTEQETETSLEDDEEESEPITVAEPPASVEEPSEPEPAMMFAADSLDNSENEPDSETLEADTSESISLEDDKDEPLAVVIDESETTAVLVEDDTQVEDQEEEAEEEIVEPLMLADDSEEEVGLVPVETAIEEIVSADVPENDGSTDTIPLPADELHEMMKDETAEDQASMVIVNPESIAESVIDISPDAPPPPPIEITAPPPPPSKRVTYKSSRLQKELDSKLLAKYAEARRDQHEVIASLVDTLAKVDNLSEDQLNQARDALFHTDFPFLMVLVGPFSSGKSSVMNALLGEDILKVGPIPTTDHIHILRYGEDEQTSRNGEITTIFHPHPLLQNLSFVDTPGLESVFEQHDEITRSFLHRADLVVLVMVATHVLSSSNLDFLKELRAYGKRIIIMINQIDLIDKADRETVRDFVSAQSRLHLGVEPTIWMVSAKEAMSAQSENPRDEISYDDSGYGDVEEYIVESLNDGARIRQKLETSMQIAENVRKSASELVNTNSSALNVQQKTLTNIESQIEGAVAEQRRHAEKGLDEVNEKWSEAITRGVEAIQELFHFSRAFGQIFAGLAELLGIAALLRRFGNRTRAQAAFDKHDVLEPLEKIQPTADQIGARLEGRDLQDLDDLVTYTQKQIEALPPSLKNKVIGKVQSPMSYDRSHLRQSRSEMEGILEEASRFETKKIDRQLNNLLIVMAIWQIIVISITAIVAITSANTFDIATLLVFFFGAILVALLGLTLLPIRGFFLQRGYRNRMQELKERYLKLLREALYDNIGYGEELRQSSVAPFTRLVETQAGNVQDLRSELNDADQAIQRIRRGIAQF